MFLIVVYQNQQNYETVCCCFRQPRRNRQNEGSVPQKVSVSHCQGISFPAI